MGKAEIDAHGVDWRLAQALHSGCDVLPVHISGTHQVLGKVPHHYPVEVCIGGVFSNALLHEIAQSANGAGAYRPVSDFLRRTVAGLPLGHKMLRERVEPKPREPVRRRHREPAHARQTN